MATEVTTSESQITEDEAKIYDRQIRLWGLDAQKRLRAARVLVIGLGGLGAEIAKNIILAGVKSVHLMDDKSVTERDFRSQTFIRKKDLGLNRATCCLKNAQVLNPMVEVTAESASIADQPMAFFANYDVICANNCDWTTGEKLDQLCRKNGIKLFLGGCFGLYGYMLSDLGSHEYVVEVDKKKQQQSSEQGEPLAKKAKVEEVETKTIKKVVEFRPLKLTFTFKWSDENNAIKLKKVPNGFFLCRVVSDFISKNVRIPELEDKSEDMKKLEEIRSEVIGELSIDEKYFPLEYLDGCYGELISVCAVVGGIISQEVIKVVSRKDLPHNNFFFFDGVEGCGLVDQIGIS